MLVKVPCKCGCSGCYYDNFEKCPIVEKAKNATDTLPYSSANWECVKENCIFVEDGNEQMGG